MRRKSSGCPKVSQTVVETRREAEWTSESSRGLTAMAFTSNSKHCLTETQGTDVHPFRNQVGARRWKLSAKHLLWDDTFCSLSLTWAVPSLPQTIPDTCAEKYRLLRQHAQSTYFITHQVTGKRLCLCIPIRPADTLASIQNISNSTKKQRKVSAEHSWRN